MLHVAGGVGPMTIAMLLQNTLRLAERACAPDSQQSAVTHPRRNQKQTNTADRLEENCHE
jgi:hypothetical protein